MLILCVGRHETLRAGNAEHDKNWSCRLDRPDLRPARPQLLRQCSWRLLEATAIQLVMPYTVALQGELACVLGASTAWLVVIELCSNFVGPWCVYCAAAEGGISAYCSVRLLLARPVAGTAVATVVSITIKGYSLDHGAGTHGLDLLHLS
jgi:hypothetical protein